MAFLVYRGGLKYFHIPSLEKISSIYQPWYCINEGVYEKIEITNGREQSKTIVAHIKGIDNRDQSLKLIGKDLYIDKEKLPKLADGKHYWYELVGFNVINQDKIKLGVVDYLVDTGSNNVLVTKGKKEYWIPYVEPFLVSIDQENREIIVDWDEDF